MIENDIEKVLSTIQSSSNKTKENVTSLKNDIVQIENDIEKETINSYKKIETSLSFLKDQVIDAENKIDNIEYNIKLEKANHLIDYYKTIVSNRNEFNSYTISNVDELFNYLDDYTNEKNEFFKNYQNSIMNNISNNDEYINNINNAIISSLFDYKNILNDYKNRLYSKFDYIISEINSISKQFFISYEKYLAFNNELKNDYYLNKNNLLDKIPTVKNLLYNDSKNELIDNSYLLLIENNKNIYIKRKNEIKNNFIKENNSIIDKIDYFINKYFNIENPIDKKDYLFNEFGSNEFTNNIISKVDNYNENKDIDDLITLIFKKLNEESFNKYRKDIIELDSNYLYIDEKARNYRLFNYFMSKYENSDNLLENELSKKDILSSIIKNYKKFINDSLDNISTFDNETSEKILKLNIIMIEYKKYKDLLVYEYKNKINILFDSLKKELSVIYLEYENKLNNNKYIYNSIIALDQKSRAFLKYITETSIKERKKMEVLSLNELYLNLRDKEKEFDLIEPKAKLDKILTEYNVIENSYKTIYEQEIESLEKTKIRNEIENLTNYKYAYSFLNHQLLVAKKMLDMAISEYSLRVNFLNEILNESKKYSSHRINSTISKYMDKIDELNNIKNVELKSILERLELITATKKKEINKIKDTEKENLINILDNFSDVSNKIISILKNDQELLNNSENKEHLNLTIIDGINNAQAIRNKSIELALKQIEKSNQEFENIMSSLESDSIDYSQAYNSYKETYYNEKDRLELILDKESSSYIDKIKEIDDYYKKYNTIVCDKENYYNSQINDLYLEMLKEYEIIDANFYNEYNIEDIDKDYNNKLKNIILEHEKSQKSLFLELKNKENNCIKEYNNNLKKLNNQYEILVNKNKKDILIDKNNFTNIANDIYKENKKTFNKINKIINEIYKNNKFELNSFKDHKNIKLNKIKKKLKNKYKNMSIADLK